MGDPFDVTNFDSVLQAANEGKVVMLSDTEDKKLSPLSASLLVHYIVKFYTPEIKKDGAAVSTYDALYELLTSKATDLVLADLKEHLFAGDDIYHFQALGGSCEINFFGLMYLTKFLDVSGRITNVPVLDIVIINKYLYNQNQNCASLNWFKDFIPQYAQVLKDRTQF